MLSQGSRILAAIAAGVLFVSVHPVRAADFAGSYNRRSGILFVLILMSRFHSKICRTFL